MKTTYTLKLFLLLLTVAFVAGCNKEEEESPFVGKDNAVAEFTLAKDGVTLHGEISKGSIVVAVPEKFSLSGATATVTLSENAAIAPDPATITDWDAPQTFTITSFNGVAQTYAYSVERYLLALEGDIVLLTQADVNAFAAEVEAQGIDQINGIITFGQDMKTEKDTITLLPEALSNLKVVTGGIIINNNCLIKEVAAFTNLEKTGVLKIMALSVENVSFPKLHTVRLDMIFGTRDYGYTYILPKSLDFPELKIIDKGLLICRVDSLSRLNFPKLQEVGEGITLWGDDSYKPQQLQLLTAVGFPALQKTGGAFYCYYLREVTAIDLPELVSTGGFTFSGLDKLESVSMPKLKTVKGDLPQAMPALANIIYPMLETVTGNLTFSTSATLTTLQFPALKSAGTLTIPNAANLTLTAQSFPALKTITGDLTVELQSITSFEAFDALESVGRLVLTNLSTLTSLPAINASAYTLSGLTALTQLDVRGLRLDLLELNGTTLTDLTLIGDDEFPGKLYFLNAPAGTTDFPVTIQQGFKKVGELQVALNLVTAFNFSWLEEVEKTLYFSTGTAATELTLPNLKQVGALRLENLSKLGTLNVPNLEKITGYIVSGTTNPIGFDYLVQSNTLLNISLPALKSVAGNIRIYNLVDMKVEVISFPELQSITGELNINVRLLPNTTTRKNLTFQSLSGFSKLTQAASVTIYGFTNVKDFEPLKGLFPALPSNAWTVGNCGYNPTHQDMVDGKWTKQ